jgi:coatomer subunit beta'
LLLLRSSTGNKDGLQKLAAQADAVGANNIAFSALWACGDVDACIDLLVKTGRVAEAVLFSQTYRPSRATALVKVWKEGLEKNGKGKIARLVGQPPEKEDGVDRDDELFPDWDEYLQLEKSSGMGKESVEQRLVDVDVDAKADGLDGVNGKDDSGDANGGVSADVIGQVPKDPDPVAAEAGDSQVEE